uniref:Capsid protein n=1 Tax=Nandayus nenday CRESS-DNA-virus sp. TaxID=2815047 RepID=A0A8A4XCP8_9VIRU|nr:MAG: capsid protein [Nandayus nenday CRESS-DNA-virus sp.]
MAYYSRRLIPGRRTYSRRRVGRYRRGAYRRGFVSAGRVGKSHFSACSAVYHNPFSTATTNPKIPDGKTYASTGLRLQAVTEISNDATGPIDILLFPGLGNGVVIDSSDTAISGNTRSMPYNDHGRFSDSPYTQTSAAIHKWRIVSQALKITLINNSDENDGWFEAIRIQGSDDSGFGPAEIDGEEGNFIGASTAGTLPALSSTNLVEHPTYCTGKLRDIHKYLFHLMPQGNDHDFNIIPRATTLEFAGPNLDNENYDMVFIRVHGRAGSASPTRLMLHVVSNQEVVYDEGTFMTRYHSECQGNKRKFDSVRESRVENGENTRAGKVIKARMYQTAVSG